MKIEKFKVLLYLKKSGMDKNGKAPIMGRITVNRTMAQFSCKLSCTPSLWNPRASRLEGKSKEAVETNKDIEQLLLSIQKAFDVLVEKSTDLPISTIRDDTRSPASLRWRRCADKLEEYTVVLGNRASLDSVAGTYCGVLPPNVETTLTLNADGTYLLIQSYNEK